MGGKRSATGADKMDWCTPPELWKFGLEVFGVERFSLDPAGSRESTIPAEVVYIGERGAVHEIPERELLGTPYMATDGLAVPWASVPTWFNPPWGKPIKGVTGGKTITHLWVEKLLREAEHGEARVCALLPCKVETEWWRDLVEQADVLTILPFRPRFVDPATGKPAGNGWSACALVLFSANRFDAIRFRKACTSRGWTYRRGNWQA